MEEASSGMLLREPVVDGNGTVVSESISEVAADESCSTSDERVIEIYHMRISKSNQLRDILLISIAAVVQARDDGSILYSQERTAVFAETFDV